MIVEYVGENFGRIERLVERDASGDPPERVQCGNELDCGARIAAEFGAVICDQSCELAISGATADGCRRRDGERFVKDRRPGMLDTRPLARAFR